MDTYRTIVTKRDRRNYDLRDFDQDSVNRILQAGRMAGSASNSQPCRFIVVKNPDTRQRLAAAGRGGAPLRTAPLCVVVLLKKDGYAFDAGRAAQNMMVSAWSDGIVSCPVGLQDEKLSKEILGFPDDYEVAITLAFGYPSRSAESNESQKRLPLEELVHQEHW